MTILVVSLVHVICERQLFEVALREKPDLVDHTGESASCYSSAGETEKTDVIPGAIWLGAGKLPCDPEWICAVNLQFSIKNIYPSVKIRQERRGW